MNVDGWENHAQTITAQGSRQFIFGDSGTKCPTPRSRTSLAIWYEKFARLIRKEWMVLTQCNEADDYCGVDKLRLFSIDRIRFCTVSCEQAPQ